MNGSEDEIRFGPFRLSRRKRSLTSETGPVGLGTRAFDLLVILLERPGKLLSKLELLDLVWPGVMVEENNLHVQMVALRRALGAQQSWIQTVPGRGYRFIGDIEQGEAELAATAPPVVAPVPAPPAVTAATNLPIELDALIGREAELAELQELAHHNRLLTIAGPGGIGKTRLAVALGHAVRPRFPGGVQLIDLGPLADGSLVEGTVAKALGLQIGSGAEPVEAIAAALGDRPTLLLLDNCEHLLGGVANFVARLLGRTAAVSVISTSQERLRVEGEIVYRLDPLALPPQGALDAGEMARFGAVALFVRRVEVADRRFRIGQDNSAAIAEICRRLDGIPLALEMAAARVPMLGIEGLRSRLGERLRVLTLGARTAAARQRTLRDTVVWSCALLDADDRAVFRRLGVFAGGFSAQAAAEILASDDGDSWAVEDALGRLIDKSLVVAEGGEIPRYRLLETLRMFAIEQLLEHGEQADFAARHAVWYDRCFARAYDAWEETDDAVWIAAAAPELDNLRAALNWALRAADRAPLAISLAGAASLLWEKLSLFAEGRGYLERAEAMIDDATPPALAARLYRHSGSLWHPSDRPRALAALQRAAAIYRALGDEEALGSVLALMGSIQSFLGAADEAVRVLRDARGLLEGSKRRKSLFNVLNNLGALACTTGEMAQARDLFEEAMLIARPWSARDREATVLVNLAEIEFNLGRTESAVNRGRKAAALLRAIGQQADLGWALVNLTAYLLASERPDEALEVWSEGFRLVRPVGGFILRAGLEQAALLAAGQGRLTDAARLAGFVDAGYRNAGETRQPTEQTVHDLLWGKLEPGLSPHELARLTRDGAGWTEAQASAFAAGEFAAVA